MRKLFLLFCILILTIPVQSKISDKYFSYIDPLPDAKNINKEACIIIKPNGLIDKNTMLSDKAFIIRGTLSGECKYSIIESSDNATVIIKPVNHFKQGETVTVDFTPVIKSSNGAGIKPFSFTFHIKSRDVKVNRQLNILSELSDEEISRMPFGYYNGMVRSLPEIALTYTDNPAPGRIFISNFGFFVTATPYLLILNNDASVFYSEQASFACFDFKVQPNGNLTYYHGTGGRFYEMDEYYEIINSYACGNGYTTDIHELRLLPNRHALLMAYDSQYVDMSGIVIGGNPNAVVSGLIIQELDEYKNVVFQWRSWDHFQITDASHQNLLGSNIDYVHGNAIELDNDGNIMISSRHLDEITKINRTTGAVMWRMGGKKNQFTFPNDPDTFNYQHGIRRLKNGNVILFDNGNFHAPPYSRAIEYQLDEVNKIATMVWQYRNTPEIFGPAMGFAHRLENGNTIIGWGFTNPTVTEVRPDGTKALEINLTPGTFSYRAFKYEYKMNETIPLYPPTSAFLGQNYPNPFNPKTTISFGIPRINASKEFVDVKLKVYDVLGREIATLINEPKKPYTYNVNFDASGLATGVYFYRLTVTGGESQYYETKKMIVVK